MMKCRRLFISLSYQLFFHLLTIQQGVTDTLIKIEKRHRSSILNFEKYNKPSFKARQGGGLYTDGAAQFSADGRHAALELGVNI